MSLLKYTITLTLIFTLVLDAYAKSEVIDFARLWSEVKYKHPTLASKEIDWDRAMVDALPLIEAAKTNEDYLKAASKLLEPLGDPNLQIGREGNWVDWDKKDNVIQWLDNATALVHLHSSSKLDKLNLEGAESALKLILDLRPSDSYREFGWETSLNLFLQKIVNHPVLLPALRYRVATGPRPEYDAWDGLSGGFFTSESDFLIPTGALNFKPLVFIFNKTEPIPRVVLALQYAGLAKIVAEGNVIRIPPIDVFQIGTIYVEYSSGELTLPSGRVFAKIDKSVASDSSTNKLSLAVKAAKELIDDFNYVGAQRVDFRNPTLPVRKNELTYPENRFPSLYWRKLAAIKLWSIIEYHYPARSYISSNWDMALEECISKMEKVTNELEYSQAIEDMAALIDDSHVRVFSRALRKYIGTNKLGILVEKIEGKYVVVDISDDKIRSEDKLKVGDEIYSIDGVDFEKMVNQAAKDVASSTIEGRVRNAIERALLSSNDGAANVKYIDKNGKFYELSIPKIPEHVEIQRRNKGETFKVLPNDIGYVDLGKLEKTDVQSMFNKLNSTKAIIFDMRGYPKGVTQELIRKFRVKKESMPLFSYQNIVTSMPGMHGIKLAIPSVQSFEKAERYRGKLVMLINEHTQSQAEDLAMELEAVAPIKFVGSKSAGTNGDIRHIALPGKIFVSYSGFEVRFADGRQHQRKGIVPDYEVLPTIEGVRAGKDEVLDFAVKILDGQENGKISFE